MNMIDDHYLPWHESNWQVLQNRRVQNRLPHALLFVGVQGVGKRLFAKQFAKSLLCLHSKDDGVACRMCRACQWFESKTHADFLEIVPEDEKKPIKVDQIREFIDFNYKTASVHQFKVMIIDSAHALNINAANALLKTLEEPADDTVIILITEHLMMLPATIRSRCQMIYFPVPHIDVAVPWLKKFIHDDQNIHVLLSLSQNAPLKVLKFLEQDEITFRKMIFEQWMDCIRGQSVITVLSETWSKLDFMRLLMHWKTWMMDIIHLKQVGAQHVLNQDLIDPLNKIAKRSDLKKLYHLLDELNQAENALRMGLNFNQRLMIEHLLIGEI